jgi:hypothetical protein
MMGWLLALLMSGSGAAAAQDCTEIAGWDAVLADDATRWIVLGEMHGNNESPAVFADAVCQTARSRAVVAALELPDTMQPQIDAFLASDGGVDAQQALLAAPFWHETFKDGRSSRAMFRMIQRLQVMYRQHMLQGIVAFQATSFTAPPSQAEYEAALAARVQQAAGGGATVLVLVGNVHARLTEVRFGTTYLPMAAHLPQGQTIALDIKSRGGDTWACTGRPIACRTTPMRGDGLVLDGPEVRLDAGERSDYSGTLDLGSTLSTSEPQ